MFLSSLARSALLIVVAATLMAPLAVSLATSLAANPLRAESGGAPGVGARLADFPRLARLWEAPAEYLRGVDAHLKEHFGLREFALDLNARLRSQFGAPVSGKVVVGESGWLFFAEGLLDRPRESSRYWQERLENQAALLESLEGAVTALGARFLVVPVPDKHTIYPEYLPAWLRERRPDSNHARLVKALQDRRVAVLDVEEPLLRLKQSAPVYYRTDTHWTPIGALAAFNLIVERMGLPERRLPIDLEVTERMHGKYDLVRLALFTKEMRDWSIVGYRSAVPNKRVVMDPVRDGSSVERGYEATRGGAGLTVVVIGDSFTRVFLQEPLLDVAARIVWMHHSWCHFDWARVRDAEPDWVLYESVERYAGCSESALEEQQRAFVRSR